MLAYQRLHTGRKDIIFAAYVVFQPHHFVLRFAFQPFSGWPAAAPRALKIPLILSSTQPRHILLWRRIPILLRQLFMDKES